ncbi:VLRF1 family aeRF1-type release factor [Nonomuraea lactucae]|uniref:VLRF1 family aeRF1-type release factor n=1 Tax=Nonomuraea lactucae TaxID=2249762 RepID=UPI001F0700DC|nr:VLRF1 family aeRF1-type release factor [Nonomuraea lactucae]
MHDLSFLRELVAMKDEMGVVSLYVTVKPRAEAEGRPPWEIRLRHALRDVREQVTAWPDRIRRATVLEHLDALEPEVAELVDPAAPGLGRALFAPVCTGEIRRTSLQVPVGTGAALEPTPYVRPLLTAMATSAPAGVVVVRREGVRLIDYRYGLADDVYRSAFDLDTDDRPRQSSEEQERSLRRAEESRRRYLHAVAPEISNRIGALRWTDVLLIGDPRLTGPLAEALHPLEPVQIDKAIEARSAAGVVGHIAPELAAVRVRRDAELIGRVRDLALSGGRGSLGIGPSLALLNEGRVDCLLLDENGRWRGGRGPDGFLYPAGRAPHGVEVVAEPDLGERMIERALESGAEVMIVHADAAAGLAEHDGVGALLRW